MNEKDRLNKRLIKNLIWLYFWLLIFEGALRKWIFPSLSDVILVVRDPIALYLVFKSWRFLIKSKYRSWLLALTFIAIPSLIIAVTIGHGDLVTAIYGARILLIHFPIIFIIPSVFNKDEVLSFCRALLLVAIPMTVLICLQYSLPQSHFLNIGIGGEGSSGFSGAEGKFRSSGTFSFTNSLALFYIFSFSSFLTLVNERKTKNDLPYLLLFAAPCLAIAAPISISRTLFLGYLSVLAFTFLALIIARSSIIPLVSLLIIIAISSTTVVALPLGQDAIKTFSSRWETASQNDEQGQGVLGRVGNYFFNPIEKTDNLNIFGKGIGMATSVGTKRLINKRGFLIAEDAWSASMGELGFILGSCFIYLRIALTVCIVSISARSALLKNVAPLIFCGGSLYQILVGQLNQANALGFIIFSSGLTIALCNENKKAIVKQ